MYTSMYVTAVVSVRSKKSCNKCLITLKPFCHFTAIKRIFPQWKLVILRLLEKDENTNK